MKKAQDKPQKTKGFIEFTHIIKGVKLSKLVSGKNIVRLRNDLNYTEVKN